MKSLLCKVAAFTNMAEAEWARCQLGFEGIPAWLDNVHMVQWFWYYSQVTGGVKVLVRTEDADRSRDVLIRPSTPDKIPRWPCSQCGESLPGSWNLCWRCGTARDGAEYLEFFRDSFPTPSASNEGVTAGVVALTGILVLLTTGLWFLSSLFWAVAFLLTAMAVFSNGDDTSRMESLASDLASGAEPEPVLPVSRQSRLRRQRIGSQAVGRAWREAVFALYFPPLILCSVITLCRAGPRRWELRRPDRLRYWGAWTLNLLVALECNVMLMFYLYI